MPRPPNLPHPRDLALLRLAVGAAGERYGWWRTQFTKPVGRRMLGQLFPRTTNRAVVESVTLAARRDHDARISRGGFHLFRLPTQLEDRVGGALDDASWLADWLPRIDADVASLLGELGSDAGREFSEGPALLGPLTRAAHPRGFSEMAAAYHRSTTSGRIYPYFEIDA
jgi:hypothetical protein